MSSPVRLLIVEDSATLAEALVFAFGFEDGIEPIGVAPTIARALEIVEADQPDVVLMDVRLPDGSGIDAAARVVALRPGTPVVIMTAHADHLSAFDAARAGAAGFLLKDVRIAKIVAGVRQAAAGGVAVDPAVLESVLARAMADSSGALPGTDGAPRPSAGEQAVLELLAGGLDPAAIAARLGLAEREVDDLAAAARDAVGARSNLEAVVNAAQAGLLRGPDQGWEARISTR